MSASELKKLQRKQKKAQLKAKAKAQEEKGKPYKPYAYVQLIVEITVFISDK
jgi:hypothetical protein